MKDVPRCPSCGCVGITREFLYASGRWFLRCRDCEWRGYEEPKRDRRWGV